MMVADSGRREHMCSSQCSRTQPWWFFRVITSASYNILEASEGSGCVPQRTGGL